MGNNTTLPAATDGRIDLTEAFKLRYKHGLSYQQIADRFGVSKQSVHQRLTSISELLPDRDEIETYRQLKTEMLDALEYKVYRKMLDDDKLKDASFNNLAYGFQNICTQNRLEKGQSTANIDIQTVTASLSEIEERRKKILIDIQPVVPSDNPIK